MILCFLLRAIARASGGRRTRTTSAAAMHLWASLDRLRQIAALVAGRLNVERSTAFIYEGFAQCDRVGETGWSSVSPFFLLQVKDVQKLLERLESFLFEAPTRGVKIGVACHAVLAKGKRTSTLRSRHRPFHRLRTRAVSCPPRDF